MRRALGVEQALLSGGVVAVVAGSLVFGEAPKLRPPLRRAQAASPAQLVSLPVPVPEPVPEPEPEPEEPTLAEAQALLATVRQLERAIGMPEYVYEPPSAEAPREEAGDGDETMNDAALLILAEAIVEDFSAGAEATPAAAAAAGGAGSAKGAKVDMYRDSLLRYAGYANEVGESFKPLIPRAAYLGSYGVASTYVLADAADKTLAPGGSKVAGLDVLLWQALASVIIPGFVVNRWVSLLGRGVARWGPTAGSVVAKWTPTVGGMAIIPFIIHPIDSAVDVLMDRTVRIILPEHGLGEGEDEEAQR